VFHLFVIEKVKKLRPQKTNITTPITVAFVCHRKRENGAATIPPFEKRGRSVPTEPSATHSPFGVFHKKQT
jgi:hypothetical protein